MLVMYFVLRGKFIVICITHYIGPRPFTLGRTIFLISPELHSTQLYIFNGSDLSIHQCMYTLEIFVVGVMAFFYDQWQMDVIWHSGLYEVEF